MGFYSRVWSENWGKKSRHVFIDKKEREAVTTDVAIPGDHRVKDEEIEKLEKYQLLGTLRSKNGDGRQNVAEKVNSRSSNLHRDYSKSLTLSNVDEPS